MGTLKKGTLTASPEWAKHLRPRSKRQYWRRERLAEKALARQAAETAPGRKTRRGAKKSPAS